MKSIFISGYRSYELNVFDQNDPKYVYLKEFIKDRLKSYIENGVEWFVITGQLGIELWAGEILIEMREDYPEAHLAVLLPYTSFGEKWNDTNRGLLEKVLHQADYVNYTSNKEYESPKQLNANQMFTIRNTDGAFLIYDTMMEEAAAGSPKYVYRLIENFQEKNVYELNLVGFEEIELFIHDFNMSNEQFLKDILNPDSPEQIE